MYKTLRTKLAKTVLPATLAISLMGTTYINANAAPLSTAQPVVTSASQVQPAYIYSPVVSYNLKLGYAVNIPIVFSPTNTTSKVLNWTSDNTDIVTVKDGIVSSRSKGTCRVTATTSNGLSTTIIMRVVDPKVSEASTALKAVQRAYDYLDLYGAKTKNPIIANPAEKRTYVDTPYSDGKRYTDCGGFVSFCYKSTGVFLGSKLSDVPTADDLINKINDNFSRYTLSKAQLKVGDIITLKDYYMKGMSHATMIVKNDSTGCYVIDMSPNGISYRTLDEVTKITTYNVIRCNK